MRGFQYPEPGEVWEWESSPPQSVYVIAVVSKHSHGRRFHAIDLGSGRSLDVFFRRESYNGWIRVA